MLTRRLLREAAADLHAKAKAAVQGKQVTMQADGWTGINHHHLIAFMVTCDKKVHFKFAFGIHISSSEPETKIIPGLYREGSQRHWRS